MGPFYDKKGFFTIELLKKAILIEKGRHLRNKQDPARNTAGTSTEVGSTKVVQKRLGSNFQMAMSGITDPINLVNPFFYSFGQIWPKSEKIKNL